MDQTTTHPDHITSENLQANNSHHKSPLLIPGNPEMALHLIKTWEADEEYNETVWSELEPALDRSYSSQHSVIGNGQEEIEMAPQMAQVYYNRGNTYATLGRYDQALADYNQAISIAPNLAPVYNKRGFTYHKLGRYEEALVDYTRAIRITENSS